MIEGIRLAPQGFAHRRVLAAGAVQPLLGAVVEARDALQREQTADTQRELVRESLRVLGRAEVEARCFWSWLSRNVTKKRLASPCELMTSRSTSLRCWNIADDFGGRSLPFGHGRQLEEERENPAPHRRRPYLPVPRRGGR